MWWATRTSSPVPRKAAAIASKAAAPPTPGSTVGGFKARTQRRMSFGAARLVVSAAVATSDQARSESCSRVHRILQGHRHQGQAVAQPVVQLAGRPRALLVSWLVTVLATVLPSLRALRMPGPRVIARLVAS